MEQLLKKLGKRKTGVGCLCINKLEEIDLEDFEAIIDTSLARKWHASLLNNGGTIFSKKTGEQQPSKRAKSKSHTSRKLKKRYHVKQ